MTKLKTHQATKKRVTVTGSGKITSQHAARRHLLTNKSKRQSKKFVLSKPDTRRVRNLLPGI